MEFRFFYGPDRLPFAPVGNGSAEENSAVPFHGIVSRGLLDILRQEDPEGTLWHRYAHLLEIPEREEMSKDGDHQRARLQGFAQEAGALTFGQSARCAQLYVMMSFSLGGDAPDSACELWNVKEGHTSSVWKCSFEPPGAVFSLNPFVLNVARDRAAGKELEETSLIMQKIAAHYPGINMAKVRDVRRVLLDLGREAAEVVVTKNDFIDHSFEVHRTNGTTGDRERWFLVERFLTGPASPSQITSIVGRSCSKEEIDKIIKGMEHFCKNVPPGIILELKVNEGDVVWDGEQAIIVALS